MTVERKIMLFFHLYFQNTFSLEEMRQVAQMLGLQQDKMADIVESLNNQGFLIKKANKLYQLMSLDI
jgi:hypothetical protein